MSRAAALPWAVPAPLRLAPGERLVWQGAPRVRPIALRLYRLPWVAGYGLALMIADAIGARLHGGGPADALQAVVPGALTALGALGIFALLACGTARTTQYTLTDRRLVLRFGLALPATLSIPLHRIAAIAVRVHDDGTGDIAIRTRAGGAPGRTLGYLKLWPCTRPWRLAAPEPMLREMPEAGYVASVLSRMVATAQPVPSAPPGQAQMMFNSRNGRPAATRPTSSAAKSSVV